MTKALGQLIADDSLEPAFQALMLTMPSFRDIALSIGDDLDPDAIHEARRRLKKSLGKSLKEQLEKLYDKSAIKAGYKPDAAQSGKRALRNAALSLLTASGILTLLLVADYSHGERKLEEARSACARSLRTLDGYTCDGRGVLREPAGAPTADTDVVGRLRDCVADLGPTPRGVSQQVVDVAVARCAGLGPEAPERG